MGDGINGFPSEEHEPTEFLLWLERSPEAHDSLLASSGGDLAIAAYRLAVAKLRCRSTSTPAIPTRAEVFVAAKDIAARSQFTDRVPPPQVLVGFIRAAGLMVIG